ncbi:MAG: TlpA family protein disulfide reductase [Bacteroides sp.]|jgi:thiol-disulfide isomerase/thioredoxin|nr:TlpA family protein disulfide reductase [Bacteroides sp.]
MKKKLIVLLLALPVIAGAQNKPALQAGEWYGEFSAREVYIPFKFEVVHPNALGKGAELTLINGKERVQLGTINYRGDSVFIPIQDYDTQLNAVLQGDTLKGELKRLYSDTDKGVAFKAYASDRPRFVTAGVSPYSLDGKWDVIFKGGKAPEKNVGIFSTQDGKLAGSILTNTGDLRFLEGVADGAGFRLSAFAGLSPYLVEGKFVDKDHFKGQFITSRGSQSIEGTRNQNARLADPYSLTQMKAGAKTLSFRLPDLAGNMVSLSDAKYRNKVVVISILGSWCPNCLDEMSFLVPWYNANQSRGVEVIGMAFERKSDPAYVRRTLTHLIEKHHPGYDILIGGKIGDGNKVLPEIKGIKGYPTTIFIDKKGIVRKIHTGFNGPATGLFYDEFKAEFNELIDQLLKE